MKSRPRFLPLVAALYQKRRGVLVRRDCIVGHIPAFYWPMINGRRSRPKALKVHRDTSLELF